MTMRTYLEVNKTVFRY